MAKLNEIIDLSPSQKELIYKHLDPTGKLPCIKAFSVTKKLGLQASQMSDACKAVDVKISDCELGVFGNLVFSDKNEEIYKRIATQFQDSTDISCDILWRLAQDFSLKEVGSTVKKSDIEVINCQLGCFHKRKGHRER